MNQKFGKSQKLEKWLRWMETIHDEILALVQDANMFWEVQDIIRENPRIQKPNAFYSYLARTYLSHALAGLRRQTKLRKDSISFVRLLAEIAENPEELSRSYFNSDYPSSNGPDLDEVVGRTDLETVGIVDSSQLKAIIKMDDFAPYTDASGAHVCPQMVEDDRKRLESAAKKHEAYADKRIAHWDKREPKVIPSFGELDDCIKLLDRTYVKYHFLFHGFQRVYGMKYLLDTHTLLWFLKGDKKLSDRARQLIDSPRNAKFLSIASLWEIAIKENGGQGREKSFSVKSTTAAIPRPI